MATSEKSREDADDGKRGWGIRAMAPVVAPVAALVMSGAKAAWAAGSAAVDGNSRLFELARQRTDSLLSSYRAYQNSDPQMSHLLRSHTDSLIQSINQTTSKAMDVIGNLMNNPLVSLPHAHWKGGIGIVLVHDGFFNVCANALRQINAGVDTHAPYNGWNWVFHMKLMRIADGVMNVVNNTNSITVQNETLNRMADYCNSTILNYTQHLIINMTSLRV